MDGARQEHPRAPRSSSTTPAPTTLFVPSLHSAAQLAPVLERGLVEGFEALRAIEIAWPRQRDEVLK
jgi:hypothetical protein